MACSDPQMENLDPDDIKAVMTRVVDWQLENLKDSVINRAEIDKVNPIRDDGWIRGTFYSGVMAHYYATQEEKYLDTIMAWGEKNNWLPGPKPRHADDQTVAQVYAETFFLNKDKKVLEGILQNYELMIDEPLWGPEAGWSKSKNWSWCDALFMAPPGMTRIAKATGQEKYLDLMDKLFWDTYEYIYDKEEKLYYRDINYIVWPDGKEEPYKDTKYIEGPDRKQPLSPSGKKIFWGRGNGWVLAGLARTLEYLPKDYPSYPKYLELFKEMADQISLYQQEDGLWRSSLNEPTWFPNPETSSSGMFCYAMASGVNNGFLDRQKFLPIGNKAWKGLVDCVQEDGRLGWVQLTGHDPRIVNKTETVEYGSGAFLLAGNEMLKLHKSLSDPLSITIDANVSDDGVEVTSKWEQITFDPGVGAEKRHHFFGYIGHGLTMPWNKSGRYILCLRIADYKRIPVKGETADVCIIDTQNDYEVIKLTETRGWNLQQGTMFNWNPLDPENQFFFNDCAEGPNGGSTWTVLYDISDVATGGTGERVKEYKFDGSPGNPPRWVANHGIAPDGSFFVGINYGRLTFRSTTMIGYANNYEPNGYLPLAGDGSEDWPTTDGLWKVDIATGEATLIVSYDEIHTRYGGPEPYVHHTLVNRLSNRISFITRGGIPPSGNGKAINRASAVNVEGVHNLREIPVIGAYHPEWYEGTTVANSGPMGKYDIYDVDTQTNTGNYLGVNGTFVDMDNDNAYGPNGKWFVCGTPLTNPARFDYQFFRISDSYKLTPNASTGLTSAREILTGDVRIDDAPRWNRLGNAILVGGETTGAVKTRQLAIIRLALISP